MFSKKATKIDEIFNAGLTVTTYCQIDGEDFVNFCGVLRKCELYPEWKIERLKKEETEVQRKMVQNGRTNSDSWFLSLKLYKGSNFNL